MKLEREQVAAGFAAGRPDIIHAHWTYEYALGALATGIPTLVTVHDWAPAILRLSPDPYRAGRLAMFAMCLVRASHLTAVSPYIQQRVERLIRRPVSVVPNGLPDEIFARSRSPLDLSAPRIVSVNNGFGPRKNARTLLQSFAAIPKAVPAAELWLVGRGFEPSGPAEDWARSRRLLPGVRFVGALSREKTIGVLSGAAVLVHPALEESFGMTLIEAMARRVPVVAGSRSGAVPWVLDFGRAGLLTDVLDPRETAQAVVRLLTRADASRHYSESGYRESVVAFSTAERDRAVSR